MNTVTRSGGRTRPGSRGLSTRAASTATARRVQSADLAAGAGSTFTARRGQLPQGRETGSNAATAHHGRHGHRAAGHPPGRLSRLVLKPGLLVLWRDRRTVQIGVDPRRAVALTGLGRAAVDVLKALDGSRDRAGVLAAVQQEGVPAGTADRVLALLAAGDALDDLPPLPGRTVPASTRRRLGPEMATAALAHRQRDGGAAIISRRHASHVRVHGAGRIGPSVAGLLAASGVGRVTCADPQPTGIADLVPAAPRHGDRGTLREGRAVGEIRRPAPEARTEIGSGRPDLAVVTVPPGPGIVAGLTEQAIPHLVATAAEAIAVVGPLVVPGRSACLRCIDLTRRDRDPAWPLIAAQASAAEPSTPACDAVLAAAAATQAAAQVLAFIDGTETIPAAIGGTLELVLPDWRWRRRTWPVHYDCGCRTNDVT